MGHDDEVLQHVLRLSCEPSLALRNVNWKVVEQVFVNTPYFFIIPSLKIKSQRDFLRVICGAHEYRPHPVKAETPCPQDRGQLLRQASFFLIQVLLVHEDHCRTGRGNCAPPKDKSEVGELPKKAAKRPGLNRLVLGLSFIQTHLTKKKTINAIK